MKTAESLYYNGTIYCSAKADSRAETVAVAGGKILFAGSRQDAEPYIQEETELIDLKGGVMFPGFIDAHAHPVMAAYFLSGILLDVNMGRQEILAAVQKYIGEYPEKETYFGHGYAEWFFERERLHKEELDAICPDKPIVITGSSGHEGWCNSKALEMAGIDRNFPDPVPGFHFFRRDENGEPTGNFMEMGCLSILCERLNLFEEETVRRQLKQVFEYFSSIGITAIADCGSLPFMEEMGLPIIADMAYDRSLRQRIFGCCFVARPEDKEGAVEQLRQLRKTYFLPDWLEMKTLKIINDGTMESRTASLSKPYLGAARCVSPMLEGEDLQDLCLDAAGKGFDVYIHAIGDRAIHETVLAAEKIRRAGFHKTRITNAHTELVQEEDIPRFAQWNITANTTGGWHYGTEDEKKTIGERADRLFPLQSILQAGGRMSLGSDFPVDEQGANPMISMETGVTRQLAGNREGLILQPESQRLTIEQMLEGYTASAAYQLGMESKLGSIEPGKYADFTVLGADPFEVETYQIHKIPICMTVAGGKITYKKE
ncbi:amidohydrolase [Anaerovorax odorimutans]|uniref:Amidohydrolase n=1 Tax=Anaerovorax odorimutans TaxID=109327 RepID=A0ABT1RQX6_9FIRM|nr:amidohydrolase family protein [Anaerovorax odorimutans]MCQ4637592.1 amidohydrolase [Anaerovorax odorimutans]